MLFVKACSMRYQQIHNFCKSLLGCNEERSCCILRKTNHDGITDQCVHIMSAAHLWLRSVLTAQQCDHILEYQYMYRYTKLQICAHIAVVSSTENYTAISRYSRKWEPCTNNRYSFLHSFCAHIAYKKARVSSWLHVDTNWLITAGI